jgi:protein-L-isoaspartate(D-aspartate) O-methyltransferase
MDRTAACEAMIEMLRREGITDPRVLSALRRVPREQFVTQEYADRAYDNVALPIAHGQTISQPYVVARMTQELRLTGSEHVLEIGTGTGYQTAILSLLAAGVVSVERIDLLADRARTLLAEMGFANVRIHVGDGSQGYPPAAPYDAILVTAGGPRIPPALPGQLATDPPGRLLMPVGPREEQHLVLLSGDPHSRAMRSLGPVRFVPLIGQDAWETSADEHPGDAPEGNRHGDSMQR